MTVRRLPAAFVLVSLLAAAPALAETRDAQAAPEARDAQAAPEARDVQAAPEARRPGQIARDAADGLMRRLEELAAALPRYGLPQIAENGDIVIPRLDRPQPPRAGSPGQETLDL